jgi:hypothetical protein
MNIRKNKRNKPNFKLTSALCWFLLPTSALGHQEVELHIRDSEIRGLPGHYSPSLINWQDNSLDIKGKHLKLPKLFSSFLNSERHNDKSGNLILEAGISWQLSISASWFHQKGNEGDLPDYMVFTLKPINKDYRIEMIIDLEAVAIVGVRVIVSTFSKDNGDVWVNKRSPILESATSAELELVVDETATSVWERRKRVTSVGP